MNFAMSNWDPMAEDYSNKVFKQLQRTCHGGTIEHHAKVNYVVLGAVNQY